MNKRYVFTVIGVVSALLVAYSVFNSVHSKPMTEMRSQLKTWTAGKEQMLTSLNDEARVRQELAAIAETTLGHTSELAEHRLRTLLTELCTTAGLNQFVISCKEPKPLGNPAAREKPKEFSREQRQLADCVIQNTSISGSGSYESCIKTLALLEVQPWIAGLWSISIQPDGKDREQYSIIAGVSNLVLPDLATEATGTDAQVHVPAERLLGAASQRNPFVVLPVQAPPVVEAAAKPVLTPKPKPEPYHEWLVSGIMRSSTGGEMILSNSRTGASRTLLQGGQIMGLTFASVEEGFAVLTEGESGYRVALGQSLADREAVIE